MANNDDLAAFLSAKAALDRVPRIHTAARVQAWAALISSSLALLQTEAAYQLCAKAAAETGDTALAAMRLDILARMAGPQQRAGNNPPPPAASTAPEEDDHLVRYAARYWTDAHLPPGSRRVFCVSDLHVDATGTRHMEWVQAIDGVAFRCDILIVAGDVADSLAGVRTALALLRPKFARVAFVPGNHDLWLRDGTGCGDSFARLFELRQVCAELDIDTAPFIAAQGLVILPLLSWYDCSFDTEDPSPGSLRFDRFCRWPVNDLDVWQVMLRLNHPYLTPPCRPPPGPSALPIPTMHAAASTPAGSATVIAATHFLPHLALPCPPYPRELRKAVGCTHILAQLEAAGAAVAVLGHTHVNGAWTLAPPPIQLSALPAAWGVGGSGSASGSGGEGKRLYVQFALEAACGAAGEFGPLPGLCCVFDGSRPTHRFADIATGALQPTH